jgi:hypothetical protein
MSKSIIVSQEVVENKIYLIRGMKVMFDKDLSELYEVKTKALNQTVKRNLDRFPKDFMFQLSLDEAKSLRSQNVTLKRGRHIKYQPYVFTEQGVAMLSTVLKSKKAIHVNILIMRTFVMLRKLIDTNKEVAQKISQLERKYEHHDFQIQKLFDKLREPKLIENNTTKIEGFKK